MSLGARVSSIDALRSFKASLQIFIDQVDKALCECDIELQRVTDWIAHEQPGFWSGELKKRHDQVVAAQDELRRVQFTVTDQKPSAVEQKKALKRAQGREEEAGRKLDLCRSWRQRIDQAGHEYKGQVQHIASTVEGDLPRACLLLDRSIDSLLAYVAVAPPASGEDLATQSTISVSRATGAAPDGQPDPFAGFSSDVCKALRSLVPNLEDRAALLRDVESLDLEDAPLFVGRFLANREAPSAILFRDQTPLPRVKPGREDMVLIELDALTADRFFLDRGHVQGAGDSGWYIGGLHQRGHGEMPEHMRITVRQLLIVRPELRELISLPHGYVAVVADDALQRVLDPHDTLIWPVSVQMAPDEGESDP